VRLDRDSFPEGELRGSLLGLLALGLAFLWAVDSAKADAFSMVAVQDFDPIAAEDGDDGTGGSHTLK
jgi:hypothetical protein